MSISRLAKERRNKGAAECFYSRGDNSVAGSSVSRGLVGALPRHPHTTRKRGVFRLQISVTFAEK